MKIERTDIRFLSLFWYKSNKTHKTNKNEHLEKTFYYLLIKITNQLALVRMRDKNLMKHNLENIKFYVQFSLAWHSLHQHFPKWKKQRLLHLRLTFSQIRDLCISSVFKNFQGFLAPFYPIVGIFPFPSLLC